MDPVGSHPIHHQNVQNFFSFVVETTLTVVFDIFALHAANTIERESPGLALLLRCVAGGVTLMWVFRRCCWQENVPRNIHHFHDHSPSIEIVEPLPIYRRQRRYWYSPPLWFGNIISGSEMRTAPTNRRRNIHRSNLTPGKVYPMPAPPAPVRVVPHPQPGRTIPVVPGPRPQQPEAPQVLPNRENSGLMFPTKSERAKPPIKTGGNLPFRQNAPQVISKSGDSAAMFPTKNERPKPPLKVGGNFPFRAGMPQVISKSRGSSTMFPSRATRPNIPSRPGGNGFPSVFRGLPPK